MEYPGAIYHAINRGDRREPTFRDEEDRQKVLATLAEAGVKTGWQVHAFCIMRLDQLQSGESFFRRHCDQERGGGGFVGDEIQRRERLIRARVFPRPLEEPDRRSFRSAPAPGDGRTLPPVLHTGNVEPFQKVFSMDNRDRFQPAIGVMNAVAPMRCPQHRGQADLMSVNR